MSAIFDNIKTEYQNMQRKNQSDLEARRQEIFSKHSDIEDLDNKLIKLCLQDFKAAISNDDSGEKRKDLSKKILGLKDDIKKLLMKKGYAENYLELWYNCDKCKDTGNIDSKTKCDCYNKLLFKQRTLDSGMDNEHASFERFDINVFSDSIMHQDKSQRQYMNILKSKCMNYCDEINDQGKNLVIMGKAGTGKTFLIQSIVDRVLKDGHMAKYYTATGVFNLFFKHRMGEYIDLDLLYEIPLLAIDDLGTEIMTKNVTVEYLYSLVSERDMKKLPTVISTNLSPQDISKRYGDRVFSRLFKKDSYKYLIPSEYKDVRL